MTELKIDGAANGVKTSSKKYPVYGQVTHPSLNKPFTILTTISQECFDSAVNFKPDSGDTFIVTYPKSGTTWLMNIIYLMQNNGMPVSKGECIDDIIPFLEFDGAEKAYNIPRPRVIKTHMYKAMVPFRDDVKYVLVGECKNQDNVWFMKIQIGSCNCHVMLANLPAVSYIFIFNYDKVLSSITHDKN